MSAVLAAFAVLTALAGCEAPLNLAGVAGEKSKAVLRFDQFQSVANSGRAVVTVGSAGVVLTSRDGGASWRRQQLAGEPSLIDVTHCSDGTFAALDIRRNLWLSADDGETWQPRPIETGETPLAIDCDPHGRIWVVGSFSTILSTADRGATWREQALGEDLMFTTVQFVDPGFAVLTGEFGTVVTSVDGGETWERAGDLPDEFYPQAALFTDRETGYVAGLNGQVLHTVDGGGTWERQETPTRTPLYGLVAQGGQLYAAGDFGVLLRLQGRRWIAHDHALPAFSYLRGVAPVNHHDLLLAGGMGALFRLRSDSLAEHSSAPLREMKP